MKKLVILFIVLFVMLLAPVAIQAQTASPAQLATGLEPDVQPTPGTGQIQPYLWSHSGGGLTEVGSVLVPAPAHKIYLWSHSGGGLTELATIHTTVTAVSE